VYIENLTDSTKKLFKPINEFSNVAGYKLNIQNLVDIGVVVHTHNPSTLEAEVGTRQV
jgi:hypothetical protein